MLARLWRSVWRLTSFQLALATATTPRALSHAVTLLTGQPTNVAGKRNSMLHDHAVTELSTAIVLEKDVAHVRPFGYLASSHKPALAVIGLERATATVRDDVRRMSESLRSC